MPTASTEGPTVLITGGAGFIGSHLAACYAERGTVRVLDSFRSGKREHLDGHEVSILEGSVLDRALVREAMREVDIVFHLAAMTSVVESMEDPMGCEEINVGGLLTVLEEAARAGAKRLCFSSSAAVYGDDPALPKRESMTPRPLSPYAISKLSGEHYCRLFRRERRLRTVSLRFFNVYGPRQDPDSPYASVIPLFIERALRNEPLTLLGDGEQTRDFIYVRDVVAACAHLGAQPGAEGVYNVARGEVLSIRSLAEAIIGLTGATSTIERQAERRGDVRASQACVERLKKSGFEAEWDLPRGLAETIESIRNRIR